MLNRYPHIVIAIALLTAAFIIRRSDAQAAPPANAPAWEYARFSVAEIAGKERWLVTVPGADISGTGKEIIKQLGGKSAGLLGPSSREVVNQMGAGGWELVSVDTVRHESSVEDYWFKRPAAR